MYNIDITIIIIKKMKNIIIALFMGVFLCSCSQYGVVNKKKSVNIGEKESVIKSCKEEITISNYKTIMNSKRVGFYKNPIGDDCFFYIGSMDGVDDFDFYTNIKKRTFSNSLKSQVNLGYVDSVEKQSVFVFKDESYYMKVLRYYYNNLEHNKNNNFLSYDFKKEFLFFHELFHLGENTLDKDVEQNEKEFLADIGAVYAYSIAKDLTYEEFLKKMLDVIEARKGEKTKIYKKNNSHYNKELWRKIFIDVVNKKIDYNKDYTLSDIYLWSKKYAS